MNEEEEKFNRAFFAEKGKSKTAMTTPASFSPNDPKQNQNLIKPAEDTCSISRSENTSLKSN